VTTRYRQSLRQIIADYESTLKNGAATAAATAKLAGRRVGGVLRARKGDLQERITESLIRAALVERGGLKEADLAINKLRISIPVRADYKPIDPHPKLLAQLRDHKHLIQFSASVDRHIFIRGELVCGIECKAYTENAMLKRILVDFQLLKKAHPKIVPMLFQLESMLGGDYNTCQWPCLGSPSTHTLLSHFPDVPLHIVTLIEGERDVNRPIDSFFKPLKFEHLDSAATRLLDALGI
jgi:hypothetical protein